MVKNLPAIQEAEIQSMGQEDPQEKGMATQSIILAWRLPCPEEPGGATVCGVTESRTHLSMHATVHYTNYFLRCTRVCMTCVTSPEGGARDPWGVAGSL